MAEDNAFIVQLLRGLQASMTELGQRMDKLERRQTASMHFEQSVLSHLTGIHEGQDEVKADLREIRRRLDLVEVRS